MSTKVHKRVTPDDVTDLALLPRRFDQFVVEMRQSFELLGEKIIPALNRLTETLQDVVLRVEHLERYRIEHGDRIAALEQQVAKKKRKRRKS